MSHMTDRAPYPRPISTISLGELFSWFFPGDYLPNDKEVHPIAKKFRNDPDYATFTPRGEIWASEREVGHALYVLCRLIQPKNVFEIGCHHGASSICIASALKNNGTGQLYSIDINADSIAVAKKNVEKSGLLSQVTFLHGKSASPEVTSSLPKASLIFIDGDHTYDGVRNDFLVYRGLLKDSGIMVFHDSVKYLGIRQFLSEVAIEGEYDIFTIATSDGDGMSMLKRKNVS